MPKKLSLVRSLPAIASAQARRAGASAVNYGAISSSIQRLILPPPVDSPFSPRKYYLALIDSSPP